MTDTLLVNFYSGPGTGKSTMTAHVFALLKWRGLNVEMALEYAKDKVWEGSLGVLENQIYVFGKQLHRLHRLNGKVQIILSDAPLGHSLYYGQGENPDFDTLILSEMRKFHTINYFLERRKTYNPAGRMQTEAGAREIDQALIDVLANYLIPYTKIPATQENAEVIAEQLSRMVIQR